MKNRFIRNGVTSIFTWLIVGSCNGHNEHTSIESMDVDTSSLVQLSIGSVDDVGAQRFSPLEHGEILSIPVRHSNNFWPQFGLPVQGPSVLGKAALLIESTQLPQDSETHAIGPDGKVHLSIPTDNLYLCLANTGPLDRAGPPYQVYGCVVFGRTQYDLGRRQLQVGISGFSLR